MKNYADLNFNINNELANVIMETPLKGMEQ